MGEGLVRMLHLTLIFVVLTLEASAMPKPDGKTKNAAIAACPPGCYNNACSPSGVCDSCITRQTGSYCNETCAGDTCATCRQESKDSCIGCVSGYCGTTSCAYRCPENSQDSCNVMQCRCFSCSRIDKWDYACHSDCSPNCAGGCEFHFGRCHYCKPGKWGPICQNECSDTCRHSVCNRDNGICSLGCPDGWWGENCDLRCSPNCVDPGYCGQADGSCICKVGYYGTDCSSACQNCGGNGQCVGASGNCIFCAEGYFGYDCEDRCPDYCQICDRWTGACKKCKASDKWGMISCLKDCDIRCQPNEYETCNIVTGKCNQCPPTTCGDYCQNQCLAVCEKGYFGPSCASKCPANCLGSTCEKDSGHCVKCPPGYFGDFCDKTQESHTGKTEISHHVDSEIPAIGSEVSNRS